MGYCELGVGWVGGRRYTCEVLSALAHEHDKGRVHAQSLPQAVEEQVHLVHVVEIQGFGGRFATNGLLFLVHTVLQLLVLGQVKGSPGGGDRGSVLPREEEGDQEASHLG